MHKKQRNKEIIWNVKSVRKKINNISSEEFIKLHNTEKNNDTNQQVP